MSQHKLRPDVTLDGLNARSAGHLPGWFGFEATAIEPGACAHAWRCVRKCSRRTDSCMLRR